MVTIIERSTKMGQKSDSTALCGWTAEKGEGSAKEMKNTDYLRELFTDGNP